MGLSIVSKTQLWDAESRLPTVLDRPEIWHLKSIQDAIVFDLIGASSGQRIVEIGGGLSRLLPFLSQTNECVLADPLDGRGGGPQRVPNNVTYQVVQEAVGPEHGQLAAAGPFDIAFSVSVVEHVPTHELAGFFAACGSILRDGGRMIHLIDCYITTRRPSKPLRKRLAGYRSPLRHGFRPSVPSAVMNSRQLRFETWMATNPDNMMSRWNQSVPALRQVRETNQSVSLLMDYVWAAGPPVLFRITPDDHR